MITLRRLCLVFAALLTATAVRAQEGEQYRVGPKDVLEVTVWGHTELSGKFTVAPDGAIQYPLLGAVKVGEKTPAEVEAELQKLLSDGYLRNPQLSVIVAQYLSKSLFVIGEVRIPGPIPLTGTVTLLEALARAGSMTEQAGGEVILLRRGPGNAVMGPIAPGQEGVVELGRVSVQQVRSGAIGSNVPLQDGDTIFIPRAELIYVLGQVKIPGPYTIEPGRTTVLSAIALAGGVSQLGSSDRVRVARIVDGKKTELKAKLDDLLKPGDTVTVGTRLF